MRLAAVVIAAAAVLIGFALLLAGRDDSRVATPQAGPGELQPDRGAAHGESAAPSLELPTSGPHRPDMITEDRGPITNDQLLHALELGNVVLLYERDAPPAELVRIQRDLSGGFDAEIAAAGQAVILARRRGAGDGVALAWRRIARENLREFAEAWLGRGA